MGLFDKIGSKIIKSKGTVVWERKGETDTNPEREMVYRIPNKDYPDLTTIEKFGVRDFERCLFYNSGQLQSVLEGGLYELNKEARNKATEIVWVDIGLILLKWGISYLQGIIITKDGIKVGMNGTIRIKVSEPSAFITRVVSYQKNFSDEVIREWLTSLLSTVLKDIVKRYSVEEFVKTDREDVILLARTKMSKEFQIYGIELVSIDITGYVWPPENTTQISELLQNKFSQATKDTAKKSQEVERLEQLIQETKIKLEQLQNDWADAKMTDEEYEAREKRFKKLLTDREEQLTNLKR